MIKAPVSKSALIRRVNRLLAREGKRLYVFRGAKAKNSPGEVFVAGGAGVVQRRVNLEKYARKLGALKGFETLV